MVTMVNLKYDYEIEPQMFILTINHGVNSRVTVVIVKFFDHWPWGKFQGVMVMVSTKPS